MYLVMDNLLIFNIFVCFFFSFIFLEINDYAILLGIDPVKETHLLYLAKEGLMQALPDDWKIW